MRERTKSRATNDIDDVQVTARTAASALERVVRETNERMARARASASSETAKTVASFANTTSEDGARAFKRAKKSCELAGKVVERAATDDSGSGRSNAIVRDSAHALVSNVRKSVESNARAVEIRARETEDGDD